MSVLGSSIQNATFNIFFQMLFRCGTFLMNAFVLRYITQDVIGVMNVRLLLLESTVLFLSREAFRRACLSKTSDRKWSEVVRLVWLTVPLCAILGFIFGYVWLHHLEAPSEHITRHYAVGVWAVGVSCVLEVCCEPLYLTAQVYLFIKLRIVMDMVHFTVRTITFTPLVVYDPSAAVVAFSVAQVMTALVYCLGYYACFYRYIQLRNTEVALAKKDDKPHPDPDFPFQSLREFLPGKISTEPESTSVALRPLIWSFFKQGVMKQVLTEGERYIMTLFSLLSFYEQGVYDIVNNLGSLAARFIFRPIEESAYFYFTQTVRRDLPILQQDQKDIGESSAVLFQLLRCITSLGLLILTFGQSYSALLLLLYGGENLTRHPGPLLMQLHCLAVVLLAVNGITECYVQATMTAHQIDRYNRFMAILSLAFLAASLALAKCLGASGFIVANCCNMGARIVRCLLFIKQHFKGSPYKPLAGLKPGCRFFTVLLAALVATKTSEVFLFERAKLVHLSVGVVCFAASLTVWGLEEKELLSLCLQKLGQLLRNWRS